MICCSVNAKRSDTPTKTLLENKRELALGKEARVRAEEARALVQKGRAEAEEALRKDRSTRVHAEEASARDL